jgi:hypothetical protein
VTSLGTFSTKTSRYLLHGPSAEVVKASAFIYVVRDTKGYARLEAQLRTPSMSYLVWWKNCVEFAIGFFARFRGFNIGAFRDAVRGAVL